MKPPVIKAKPARKAEISAELRIQKFSELEYKSNSKWPQEPRVILLEVRRELMGARGFGADI